MTGANEEPVRWVYRFENYQRAFLLLKEAVETMKIRALTQLEKEGLIQRFEYSWELAWKTLKDYLDLEGVILDKITPASVIRAAFEAGIIKDGDIWMRALDARNKMSHNYSLKKFEETVIEIQNQYLKILEDMYLRFREFLLKSQTP